MMSRDLKHLVDYIHYVNQFWHLALETSDHGMAQLFKRRKSSLQKKLLTHFHDQVKLDFDAETSAQTAQDVYVIRINSGGDACHIPKSDLEESGFL